MQQSKGFTLIELMIVVAIVGILTAIAYPSYLEYIRDTRRANATIALSSLAAAMERFYTTNNTYVGTASGGVPSIFTDQSPVDGGSAEYNLRITAAGIDSYTIQAQRTNIQSGDSCGDFQLTQTGAQTIVNQAAGVTSADCW